MVRGGMAKRRRLLLQLQAQQQEQRAGSPPAPSFLGRGAFLYGVSGSADLVFAEEPTAGISIGYAPIFVSPASAVSAPTPSPTGLPAHHAEVPVAGIVGGTVAGVVAVALVASVLTSTSAGMAALAVAKVVLSPALGLLSSAAKKFMPRLFSSSTPSNALYHEYYRAAPDAASSSRRISAPKSTAGESSAREPYDLDAAGAVRTASVNRYVGAELAPSELRLQKSTSGTVTVTAKYAHGDGDDDEDGEDAGPGGKAEAQPIIEDPDDVNLARGNSSGSHGAKATKNKAAASTSTTAQDTQSALVPVSEEKAKGSRSSAAATAATAKEMTSSSSSAAAAKKSRRSRGAPSSLGRVAVSLEISAHRLRFFLFCNTGGTYGGEAPSPKASADAAHEQGPALQLQHLAPPPPTIVYVPCRSPDQALLQYRSSSPVKAEIPTLTLTSRSSSGAVPPVLQEPQPTEPAHLPPAAPPPPPSPPVSLIREYGCPDYGV